MSEYIITGEQFEKAVIASQAELDLSINEVFIGGDKLPELVRCRDCRCYEYREHLGRSYCCGEYPTEPDGFCKWGERRSE